MTILVKHEPRKYVIIHEMSIYETPEAMAKAMTAGMPMGALPPLFRWVNGVVLTFTALPVGGDSIIAREVIAGKLHWDHVAFASMPEYQPKITLSDRPVSIDVMDVSPNETFRAIGSFLQNKISGKIRKKTEG